MSSARQWWALGAVSLSVLAIGLDGTVLSVALPTLAGALDAAQSDLTWFSAGYLLVLAAATLPAGLAGDRFGRKKVMLGSLVGFGAGSAVCAFAPSAGVFLAGRLLQGLAGAGVTVMALSALVVVFPGPERARAVGVYQAANFLALPLGPLLGGWMLARFWWGWVFLINVPVVLVALVVGAVLVPESRAAERPGLDPVGTVASTAGLVLAIWGLIRAGDAGWADPGAVALLAGGLVALAGFAVWEGRLGRRPGGRPLIDPALLRSASFLWGSVLAAASGLAMIGMLFLVPQFVQGVQGGDPVSAGLRLLPLIAGLVLGAGLAGRLAGPLGPRTVVVLGFAVLTAGLAVGAGTDVGSGTAALASWTAVVGAGTGLALSAATATALAGIDADRSGTASAVVQAFNKAAGPLGAAISGSVLVAGYRSRLDAVGLPPAAVAAARHSFADGLAAARSSGLPALPDSVRAAFVAGMDSSLLVSAVIAAVGVVAAALLLPGRRPADRTPRKGPTDAVPG
jgi:MFS transporter, DHA2 family, multidrug resistance protein